MCYCLCKKYSVQHIVTYPIIGNQGINLDLPGVVSMITEELGVEEIVGLGVGVNDVEELGVNDFEELGVNDVEELGVNDVEELGVNDFEELGVNDVEELGVGDVE